ncbi:MAG: hypothetical protein U1F16_16115 [Turneriella sp.]
MMIRPGAGRASPPSGSHCIKGSEGADFVFGKQIKRQVAHHRRCFRPLMIFYKTDLAEHLSECSLESVSERTSGAAPDHGILRIGRAQDMPSGYARPQHILAHWDLLESGLRRK